MHGDPRFDAIGKRTITVELIHVVRASDNSFETLWKEHVYEGGVEVRTEQYRGLASVILESVDGIDSLSRNPIGLYIERFDWSRDAN
jgi:type IV secretion system protein VirB5